MLKNYKENVQCGGIYMFGIDKIRGLEVAKPPKVETAGQVAKADTPIFAETAGSVACSAGSGGGSSLNVIA